MDKLPYSFHDQEREISFDRFDLPSPWINYLSNGRMHAFVSQAGGGMAWWLTPMLFRVSRYRFYNLPVDSPGFYVYIRMKDGAVWSPTFRPCETKVDHRAAAHHPGWSVFTAEKDGLTATLTLFMAQDWDTLIWDVTLRNTCGETVECDVFAYVELSQFMAQQENILGYYLKWNTRAVYDEGLQAITYAYTAWMHPRKEDSPLVYFGSDGPVDSYCCNRDVFCGNYRDERNPVEIENGRLSNTDLQGGEPCGALHSHIALKAGEETGLHYYLGVTKGALEDYDQAVAETRETLTALRKEGAAREQFEKLQTWWEKHLDVLQCEIPDADAAREINTWNPLQSVHTARLSRSISSDASGVRGIGFRDTAQDMLAQAYRKPDWARDMLWYLASQQFEDGHTVHTSWPEERRPPQEITRSDDHIWMVYLAYAIASETGDQGFLDKEIPFLSADLITPVGGATLWEHLKKICGDKVYWDCYRHNSGKDRCPAHQVPEAALTAAILRLHNKLTLHGQELLQSLLDQLQEIRERELRSNQKLSDIDKEIANISGQNLVLIRLKSKGCIDPALALSQADEMSRKLRDLRRLRRKVLEAADGDEQIQSTEAMLDYLETAQWQAEVTPELFENLVERITVASAEEVRFQLLNGLELAERLV